MAVSLSQEPDQGLDEALWQGHAEAAAKALGLGDSDHWGLSFTDEAEIQALNAEHRGFDKPTDVLSFALDDGFDMPLPPEALAELGHQLGDVVVCVPIARRQAEERGHAFEAELALLVVHGLLHLLGEDHDTPKKKAHMWARQGEALAALGFSVANTGDEA